MNAAAVFLIVAGINQYQYDDHMFGLDSNTSSFVLINDSGFFPSVQENYSVSNIGRSTVKAELWYGDEVQWFGIVCGATVKPGESTVLDNEGKLYYYTGLKVFNNDQERAIFHAHGGTVYSPYTPGEHFDMFKYLRKTFRSAVKYIPVNASNIFNGIFLTFWPEKQLDVWSDILYQISPMFSSQITGMLQTTIENNLNIFKGKIKNLTYEIQSNVSYMSIATDLVGVEQKIILNNTNDSERLNSYILPIYSNVISLKIHFYLLGVQFKDKIGLTDKQVEVIREYAYNTYINASKHIDDVSKTIIDYAYNYSEPPNIFNNMMTARSHLAIHGDEYIPIWKYKIANPSNNSEVYNPVVSYSTFFGKPTVNLYAQSTTVQVPQPLNPLINGEKNLLTRMTIFFWCDNPFIIKIGGVKIFFSNGGEYMMGTHTAITEDFDLEGAHILQLSAFGDGRIDGLVFHLSNGLVKTFGEVHSSSSEDFKLPNHYILSFYLSSDDDDLNGQAANIAVSYQWYVNDNN